MRLQRLTGLERDKILEEHKETVELIAKLRAILANEKEIYRIIVEELKEIKEKYGDERRTQIVAQSEEISIEDLIVDEDMAVTISHEGYIKRNPVTLYRAQRRGGKGKIGATTKKKILSSTSSSLPCTRTFFSSRPSARFTGSRCTSCRRRASREGKPIVNLLNLEPGEKVSAFLTVREFQEGRYVVFATKKGLVKKTELMSYANPRSNGFAPSPWKTKTRSLVSVSPMASRKSSFPPPMDNPSASRKNRSGRPAVELTGSSVCGSMMAIWWSVWKYSVSAATSSRWPRTASVNARRPMSIDCNPAAAGIITMKTTDKTGRVVGAQQVTEDDQLMLVTNTGKIIRLRIKDIQVIGRNTQRATDRCRRKRAEVVSLARLAEKEDEERVALRPFTLSLTISFDSCSDLDFSFRFRDLFTIMLKPIGIIGAGGWGVAWLGC